MRVIIQLKSKILLWEIINKFAFQNCLIRIILFIINFEYCSSHFCFLSMCSFISPAAKRSIFFDHYEHKYLLIIKWTILFLISRQSITYVFIAFLNHFLIPYGVLINIEIRSNENFQASPMVFSGYHS